MGGGGLRERQAVIHSAHLLFQSKLPVGSFRFTLSIRFYVVRAGVVAGGGAAHGARSPKMEVRELRVPDPMGFPTDIFRHRCRYYRARTPPI